MDAPSCQLICTSQSLFLHNLPYNIAPPPRLPAIQLQSWTQKHSNPTYPLSLGKGLCPGPPYPVCHLHTLFTARHIFWPKATCLCPSYRGCAPSGVNAQECV